MPGDKTHIPAVQLCGGALTISYMSRDGRTASYGDFAEALGGIVGGALGAALPDLLEPAIHSWHRSFSHSFTVGATMIVTGPQVINSCRSYCLQQAEYHEQLCALYQNNPQLWLKHFALNLLWRFLRGLIPGSMAGYGSHLALDAITPRGLPLLTSQF